jgi:hypothetical protein
MQAPLMSASILHNSLSPHKEPVSCYHGQLQVRQCQKAVVWYIACLISLVCLIGTFNMTSTEPVLRINSRLANGNATGSPIFRFWCSGELANGTSEEWGDYIVPESWFELQQGFKCHCFMLHLGTHCMWSMRMYEGWDTSNEACWPEKNSCHLVPVMWNCPGEWSNPKTTIFIVK